MRNLQNFDEFVREQQLNEGNLLSALKSIARFFKGINQTLQNNMNAYTKKLETTKTWNETMTNINTMVIQPNTKYFEDNMKQATTIDQIRKINYEVHLSTFTELNATYKFWDGQNPKSPISPAMIFAGTPFANMYNFTDTQKFQKNLTTAVNALVSTFAKKTGFPQEEVTKSVNSYKDLTQNPPEQKQEQTNPEQGKQQTPETPEQGKQQTPEQGKQQAPEQPVKASFHHVKSFNDFLLLEADGTAPSGSNPPTGAGNSNTPSPDQPTEPKQGDPNQNTNNTNTNNTNTNTNQQQNQQNQKGTIDSLKTENINNFKNNFYGIMQKKLKSFKPTTSGGAGETATDIQNLTKKMTGSGQNIQSKNNLLKTITDPKLTTQQLAKVRDAVGKVLNIKNPQETIGKF